MPQTEHPESSAATDAEQLLKDEFGDQIHLERPVERLPSLLAPDEKLLAVEQAGLRLGRVGLLAATNRRLIHIYYGYLLRRVKVTEIDYRNVESVRAESWKAFSRVTVQLKKRQLTVFLPTRTVHFPLPIAHDTDER